MFFNREFLFASTSESRKNILKKIKTNHKFVKPKCNEEYHKKIFRKKRYSPSKISKELSKIKALSIEKRDTLIIGCDTTISFKRKLVEKSKSKKEARKRIKKMSGKKHTIISTISAVYNSRLVWQHTEKTMVELRRLSSLEIKNYLSLCDKNILGCVGSYQIEKLGPTIIKNIKGDFFNVMGFPLFHFLLFIKKFNIKK